MGDCDLLGRSGLLMILAMTMSRPPRPRWRPWPRSWPIAPSAPGPEWRSSCASRSTPGGLPQVFPEAAQELVNRRFARFAVTAEEVGSAAVALVSGLLDGLHGQVLTLDKGLSTWTTWSRSVQPWRRGCDEAPPRSPGGKNVLIRSVGGPLEAALLGAFVTARAHVSAMTSASA